ncbi:bifunctional diguanylate cyclase/phosphodiesterase [Haloplasma contractile]|uniref:Sensor diguanylate cyclase-phosphodiesterase CHASE4 protein n=1 Tax=Haloplasma contractile SSD-17B TaxID=1033810 RepID=U2FLL6_9MOLU|nr:bifunctional diguanylate cyclase/phosphodiesterase [Haloplasma contractile]ERJ13640.1 Sensor diguanylate cyclase-phosphodiesterase CHASE4 protein [Haloplasma contractile SSD-17B]
MQHRKHSISRQYIKSALIFALLLIVTIVVQFMYGRTQTKINQTFFNDNDITVALNELEKINVELDRNFTLYIETSDQNYLDQYKKLLNTYKGSRERDYDFNVFLKNTHTPFETIYVNEVADYQHFFNENNKYLGFFPVKNLVGNQNDLIEKQQLILSNHRNGNQEHFEYESLLNEYYELNSQFNRNLVQSKGNLNDTSYELITTFSNTARITYILTGLSIVIIVLYSGYIIFNTYLKVLKPLKEGCTVVEAIKNGDENSRWTYRHNNEIKNLVNSFNNYVDYSQVSLKLVKEEFVKNKLSTDIGEINFIEFSNDFSYITINYSSKFIADNNINYQIKTYLVDDYMELIDPSDRTRFRDLFESLKTNDIKEQINVEYRIKYPNSQHKHWVSCRISPKQSDANNILGIQIDITKIKEIQHDLKESEERYRVIIENSSDIISRINHLGQLEYVSNSYCNLFGKSKNELIGKKIFDVTDTNTYEETDWINKLTRPPYQFTQEELVSTNNGYKYIEWINNSILNKNGKLDYIISIGRDITEFKHVQLKLKDREEQYRIIVENTNDLIIKVNKLGNIMYANNAYCQLFDKELDGLVDRSIYDFPAHSSNWFERIFEEPYQFDETVLIDTSNGKRWIRWQNKGILNSNGSLEYVVSIGHDITEYKKHHEMLKHIAIHDQLTGLLNRRGLFEKLDSLQKSSKLALFFIDIDNFKSINDFYSHELGDQLIIKIAERLSKLEEEGCIISRLSGDEFVLIHPNYHSEEQIITIKNEIQQTIASKFVVNEHEIYITASIGLSLYPDDTDDLYKLLSYADLAMYESKNTTKNNCFRFTKDIYTTMNQRFELINDLKVAIENREFKLVYQPILDLNSKHVEYIEALVRWDHKDKGLISPGQFLKIAEDIGVMTEIDSIVIDKSLSEFKELKESIQNTKRVVITINISPMKLLHNSFIAELTSKINEYNIDSNEVCIEINENTFMNNIEECAKQISELRKLGVQVALDDFGREYSSLSILDRVEFDIIKLDGLFVQNVKNERNRRIIKMLVDNSETFGEKVIVEGIETEEHDFQLRQLSCKLGQGFYYARPTTIDHVRKIILNHVQIKNTPNI